MQPVSFGDSLEYDKFTLGKENRLRCILRHDTFVLRCDLGPRHRHGFSGLHQRKDFLEKPAEPSPLRSIVNTRPAFRGPGFLRVATTCPPGLLDATTKAGMLAHRRLRTVHQRAIRRNTSVDEQNIASRDPTVGAHHDILKKRTQRGSILTENSSEICVSKIKQTELGTSNTNSTTGPELVDSEENR
jgi:hypothetical protein